MRRRAFRLGALLDDVAAPHRGEDLSIDVDVPHGETPGAQPQVWRTPELLHGLGNIIENAADFAQTRVAVKGSWDANNLQMTIEDDGPGFAPEIFERIGEPYVTSRPGHHALGETDIGPAANWASMKAWGLGSSSPKFFWSRPAGW